MGTDKYGELLLPSGGYRRLKSFQLAQLVYDITYNVARGSLEELKLDYQDYLRQHGEQLWIKDDLLYLEFIKRRINCKREFREFIVWAENHISVPFRTIPYKSVLVANAVLLLIDTASYFLKRQIEKKAAIFLEDGGFSERMHNMRMQNRKKQ